jgi:N-acetylneuraminic acid mutarotase
MPTGREGLGAAIGSDGTIYAIGGGTYHYKVAKCFSVVEAYSPGTNTWRRTTALPKPACAVTAGSTSSGTIDAVAGAALQGGDGGSMIVPMTGTVLALNPGEHRWTAISRTPFPRNGAGTVVESNGTVYVIGGADGFGDATATVQRYTPRGTG